MLPQEHRETSKTKARYCFSVACSYQRRIRNGIVRCLIPGSKGLMSCSREGYAITYQPFRSAESLIQSHPQLTTPYSQISPFSDVRECEEGLQHQEPRQPFQAGCLRLSLHWCMRE